MNEATDIPLLSALRDGGRLTAEQMAAAERAFAEANGDAGRLADQLLAAGCVTRYQHRKIQLGRAGDLMFGQYLILERVGEGGMGKVYRAVERRLGRTVALKTIRPNLLANKTVVSRYKREARAAAALKHPNIVELYEAEDVDGRYYLAMEFVEGMDLSRLTKELVKDKRTIAPAEAAEYIRQGALGLQHAHDKGLVHRDIKPSNLLVSGERALPGTGGKATVKILDMGLVRSLTEEDATQVDLTRDGTVVGTPDYMSPEQAKNSSTVDHRADIYSLGCTLFYLLKGAPPYHEGTAIDKLIRHQLDPVPDVRQVRPDVPPGLAGVIRKMMAKRPDDRHQSGTEVAKELARFTGEAGTFDFSAPATAQNFQFVDLAPTSPGSESRSNEIASTASTAAATGGSTAAPVVGGRTMRPAGQRTVRVISAPPGGPAAGPARAGGPQPVKPKPIAKPTGDGTPSDSLPDGAVRRPPEREATPPAGYRGRRAGKRPVKRKDDFPVWAVVAAAAAALLVLLLVVLVILNRNGSTKATSTLSEHVASPA